MTQQISIQMKLFLKNKVLLGILSLVFFICFGGSFYFVVNGADSIFLFYVITRFIFYINLLFCIMAFVFMVYAKQNDIEDMLLVSDNQANAFQKSSVIVILILFIIINVIILLFIFISSIMNNQLDIMWQVICQFYLLNILIPQFVTLLVTFMLSTMKNYYISSLLLLGFLFLTSPYMENFQWMSQPAIPIDQVINYIQLPFAYFLQNADWSIDYLYGFQNELYKICVLVFWGVLSVTIIFRKRLMQKRVYLCLGLVVCILLFSTIYIPQSKCRYNEKWDGSYKNIIDYNVLNGGSAYKELSVIDYKVTSYNLDIDIKEKLYVKGDIKLESMEPRNEYSFTLYRGYQIKQLLAEHLKSYEQQDDIVRLVFDKPVTSAVLQLTYSGYSYEMYSNYQAVMLPGYFAWYPMVGERQVFVNVGGLMSGGYGYNPYGRTDNTEFHVSVHSQYPILTNLEKTGNEVYTGNTDSLSILGGQSVTKVDGMYQNYYPLFLSNEVDYERLKQLRVESIKEIKDKINSIYDINPLFLQKKIYCGSNGLARNSGFGQYAEFDDYILLSGDGRINEDNLLKYYVYGSDLNPLLKDNIVSMGLDYSSGEEYLKTLQLSIESVLKQNEFSDEKQLKEYQNLDNEIKKDIKEKGVEGYLSELGNTIFN